MYELRYVADMGKRGSANENHGLSASRRAGTHTCHTARTGEGALVIVTSSLGDPESAATAQGSGAAREPERHSSFSPLQRDRSNAPYAAAVTATPPTSAAGRTGAHNGAIRRTRAPIAAPHSNAVSRTIPPKMPTRR